MKRSALLIVNILFLFFTFAIGQDTIPAQGTSFSVRQLDPGALESYRADVDFQYEVELEEPGPIELWLAQLQQKLHDWLNSSISTDNVVVGVIALLLVILVAWYLIRRQAGILSRGDKKINNTISLFNEEIEVDRISQLRDSCLAQSDYRGALRWQFIALLNEMQKAGLLKLKASKTNRDYRAQLSDQVFSPLFDEVSVEFDRAWYGNYTVDDADYDRQNALIEEILQFNKSS